MSAFIPEPVFHGESLYPSHPHQLTVRTVIDGANVPARVVLFDRRNMEYLAANVSTLHGSGQYHAKFTHLPALPSESIMAVVSPPNSTRNTVAADWVTAVVSE